MNKINWGIMGAGRIAGIFSAALRACEEANLYAIGSRSLEKAEEFAGLNQFQKAYGSYEELLADPQVDICLLYTSGSGPAEEYIPEAEHADVSHSSDRLSGDVFENK